ncbi:MAG: cytochrome c biogenesis protein CcsA [Gammaproteobacteria bacterium]|nr:cytochrome c biogenesis protein CcsA [Gammaproteobacteria bacterium]
MPTGLLHIFLAVLTTAVFAFAGVQALLLALQDRQLHQKMQINWLDKLPPLERMEALLFQMIWGGFLLLTALLISSIYYYHDSVWSHFFSKTILACVSWIIFVILILGRKLLGWRGRKALYCTAMGIGLVLLLYFGAYLSRF